MAHALFKTFVAACILTSAVAFIPTSAQASPGEHTLRLELGGATMVGVQTNRFEPGGLTGGAAYEFRPIPELGLEIGYRAFLFFAREGFTSSGVALIQEPNAGLRIHPAPSADWGDIWFGATGDFVITGGLLRAGVSGRAGIDFEIDTNFRLGPYVAFHHVFHEPDSDVGSGEASFLTFGLSFAFLGENPDPDGDGIRGGDDACPDEHEDFDSFNDEDGCPDPDNDGDGILDGPDDCPQVAEDNDGYQDEDGCPDPDNDGDGVLDTADRCPTEREDRDGYQDDDGCPDPDNDGDGLLDGNDQCPNEPETTNGIDDEDGCPDAASQPAITTSRALEQVIFFPHDRVRLEQGSHQLVGIVARLLRDNPQIRRLRIDAYADDTGSSDYNRELSQRRAERVRQLLIRLGVSADRLTISGRGTSREFGGGSSPDALALNRRATFTITRE